MMFTDRQQIKNAHIIVLIISFSCLQGGSGIPWPRVPVWRACVLVPAIKSQAGHDCLLLLLSGIRGGKRRRAGLRMAIPRAAAFIATSPAPPGMDAHVPGLPVSLSFRERERERVSSCHSSFMGSCP
jgi:hypothetical protein